MLEGLNQLEHYELKQLKKSNMSATKRDKVENDVIAKFNDTRRRINEGTFTSIFSYEAIFGDVFQRDGRKGFDIIIGNVAGQNRIFLNDGPGHLLLLSINGIW